MRTVGLITAGIAVALSGACGGNTERMPSEAASPGGGGDTGSSGAGSSSAGSSGAGSSGAVGSGGVGGLGVGGAGGASPGTGGSRPNGAGGSGRGGEDQLGCDEPSGGPRVDGPEPILGVCDAIADDVLAARFQNFEERVPRGFFYDAKPWRGLWRDPCSSTPEETAESGAAVGLVGLEQTFSTPWFYEASFCGDGPREAVRSVRCDYFDGQRLAEKTPENLVFLASMLWWREHQNVAGDAVLGYSVTIGDATDWVDVCTLSGTHGDFGLCDEIRLERTRHSIFYDGKVTLGEPEVLRTIQGACH